MKQKDVKLYARALTDIISKKMSVQSEGKIMNNFFKLLEKKLELKYAKSIIDLAQGYYLKKKGNKKIILETARSVNSKNTLKLLSKEGDIVEEKINPELIAGIKIIINSEKQLDFSLRRKLEEIFN